MSVGYVNDLERFENQQAIVWHESATKSNTFTYDEVRQAAVQILGAILKRTAKTENYSKAMIGVQMSYVPVIIPTILGILDSDHPFYCVDPNPSNDSLLLSLNRFSVDCFFSDEDHESIDEFQSVAKLFIWNRTIIMYQRKTKCEQQWPINEGVMFGVCTSGTTGAAKRISVFRNCLLSNVRHLSSLYDLTSNDVIFVSAPPTFDPFVLDIFLAISCGASIVLVANQYRIPTPELADILFNDASRTSSVTIMQITPSLFKQFSTNTIRHTILATSKTTLRVLILGGEPFPTNCELLEWMDWTLADRPRIMNIYGCTEMSCWSTIHEVLARHVLQNKPTPLGRSIGDECRLELFDHDSGTLISGYGVGELHMFSRTRITIQHDASELSGSVRTGDIIEHIDGHYYYKQRCDSIIKRYGNKVDLRRVEDVVKQCAGVSDACCTFDGQTNRMILFVCSTWRKHLLHTWLIKELSSKEMPDSIHIVQSFPLSSHGKVSKQKLLAIDASISNRAPIKCASEYLLHQLVDFFDFSLEKGIKYSFSDIGGTSFWALSLVSDIESRYETQFPELMQMLLDNSVELGTAVDYVQTQSVAAKTIGSVSVNSIESPRIVWSMDFGKCVDATPTIFQYDGTEFVAIGSHSHLVRVLQADNGKVVLDITLPDRIESQWSQIGTGRFGVVGCYDGWLYCMDAMTGAPQWSINSTGMIKCRPLTLPTDRVIVGNYGTEFNVWCFNAVSGALEWGTRVGAKSIYANPLALDTSDNDVVICTLGGEVAKIDSRNGNIIWAKSLTSPIFASPLLLAHQPRIIVAEVIGIVRCLDFEGVEIWNYRADGNIFSSPTQPMNESVIWFGCHDHNVYSINCTDGSLNWRSELGAPIFARVLHMSNGLLLACSTNGEITTMEADSGRICRCYRIDGDIFSSPVESAHRPGNVFVGCRNDKFYSIQI